EVRQCTGSACTGTLLGRQRWFYDSHPDLVSFPTHGLVTQRSRMADAITELVERFEYDGDTTGFTAPVGNLTRYWDAKATANGGGPTLSIAWDSFYRSFAVSSTNALSQTTSYYMNPEDGQLVRRIDPNGYLECWNEDSFGRLTADREHNQP